MRQEHHCEAHPKTHVHGPSCGHRTVIHDDHVDYVVGDHLHHVVDGRCVHHGPVPSDGFESA